MIEFDKSGNPGMIITQKAVMLANESIPDINVKDSENDASTISNHEYIPWYENDNFPIIAEENIQAVPGLKKAINDLCKITIGQGIYAGIVKDISDDGRENIDIVNDADVLKMLNNFWARRYLAEAEYALRSKGNAFVQLVPNKTGDKIIKLNVLKGKFCRLSTKEHELFTLPNWETQDEKQLKKYLLLDEIDPEGHLQQLKEKNKLDKSVFMQLKNPFSDNDYYAAPDWYAANKYIYIAEKIANSINTGIDNLLNLQYIVNVPRTYWEEKYPREMFKTEKERKEKIQADIDKLEDNFTSVENARKALIYHFDPNLNDKIEVDIVENKFSKENLMNSTAADTQIALAAGMSPDLLGLMYGNSKGGSMQRELLLLQYALSHTERQLLADPLEMLLRFNYGEKYKNVQIKFKNTFLTTLDTGSGTNNILS